MPSMSLCFRSPFKSSTVSDGRELNHSHLESYLSGKGTVEITHLKYEDTTLQLTDYLVSYYVRWRNGSAKTYLPSEYKWNPIRVSYSGFWREIFYKCFSLEITSKYIEALSVKINNMVFPHGKRPTYLGFVVMLHYPNQILRPSLFNKYTWEVQREKHDSIYAMRFYVENVEIFKRRKHCVENWAGYDSDVIDHQMQKMRCRPPYHTSRHHLPLCNTSKQMKEIGSLLSLGMDYNYPPPCKAMENINYNYVEQDVGNLKWGSNGHFWCGVYIQNIIYKVYILTLLCSNYI